MNLILQHNAWSCLPTAFAIALDVEPKEILEFCGHDGSEILWPDLQEPQRRRGFSLHEMIDFCISQLVYPVEINADTGYGEEPCFHLENEEFRLEHYMTTSPGVLVGISLGGKNHAVAWDHKEQLILDPTGTKYKKDDFNIISFFAFF